MLEGVKCRHQMLMKRGETEVSGIVRISVTRQVNRDNWRYPNFISKAYNEKTSLRFLEEMRVPVEAFCDLNDEKDYKKLMKAVTKHVEDRDAKLADSDMFRRLMRGGEPSNVDQQ